MNEACPHCLATSTDGHPRGYGYAFGVLGWYTTCADSHCGRLITYIADVNGLDRESTRRAREFADRRIGMEYRGVSGLTSTTGTCN